MIKVILFDLDDTLISEYDYIRSGYRQIAGLLSTYLNTDQDVLYKTLLTLLSENRQNVFNRLLDYYKVKYTSEDIALLVSAYRNHLPNISFYEDVLPTVRVLKAQCVYTGIITDGYAMSQRKKINSLNAEEYFDHIVLTDELGRSAWKPSPIAFELMQKHFEVAFNEMMYVGDNPAKDFYIGSLYPITTVRIMRKNGIYYNEDYYMGIRETQTIDHLEEILCGDAIKPILG